jgi:hypothetical protein
VFELPRPLLRPTHPGTTQQHPLHPDPCPDLPPRELDDHLLALGWNPPRISMPYSLAGLHRLVARPRRMPTITEV